VFPSEPVNRAVRGIWSLMFAVAIFFIGRNYTLAQTFLLSWFIGFVLMRVVIGNLGVLPPMILICAVPLSLLETFLASLIIKKMQ